MIIIYLVVATLAVFIGAAIAVISRGDTNLSSAIFGFTAGAVLGILILLVSHLYEEFGIYPIFVMIGGFLLISLIERITHQHRSSPATEHPWGADLALTGLSIHALTDGFNLVVATKSETLGTGLAVAILAHRLPVATVLTLVFLKNHSFVMTLGRLLPLTVAPMIGALIGEKVLTGAFGQVTEYMTAFAGGTLLHVLVHNFRGNYIPGRSGKFAQGIAFALGLMAVFLITYNNSDFWHAH